MSSVDTLMAVGNLPQTAPNRRRLTATLSWPACMTILYPTCSLMLSSSNTATARPESSGTTPNEKQNPKQIQNTNDKTYPYNNKMLFL